MSFQLQRLDAHLFSDLMQQWNALFERDDILWDHSKPYIEHAQRIASEPTKDPRYGIYGLVAKTNGQLSYEGFTHINQKLPKTPDAELRLVWTSLSPKYEEKFDSNDLATVTFSLLHGAILLAQGEMKARSIRLHLGNVTERDYVLGIAKGLRWTHPNV